MAINGFKLCKSDIIEILQQIMEWIDSYASAGCPTGPDGFLVSVKDLHLGIKPVYSADNKVYVYDLHNEKAFEQACSMLARAIFMLLYRYGIVSPAGRYNFIVRHIYPDYTVRLYSPKS